MSAFSNPPITAEFVRDLVLTQVPETVRRAADSGIDVVAQGWDNVVVRLGESYAVRLPVREIAVVLLEREAAWIDVVAAPLRALGLAYPEPVFQGTATSQFPWPWSVVRWAPGQTLDSLELHRRSGLAAGLGAAIASLHRPAPAALPEGLVRGVPLATRQTSMEERWPTLRILLGDDVAVLEEAWAVGLAAPAWPLPDVCIHGDTHPRNVLHLDGRLCALIDFGDLGRGDPACDLATAWLSFDAASRQDFLDVALTVRRYDDAVVTRARAWAALIAGAVLVAGDPDLAATARHTVAQLALDS